MNPIHCGQVSRIALVAELSLCSTRRQQVVLIGIRVEMAELMVETVMIAHMRALLWGFLALLAKAAHMVEDQVEDSEVEDHLLMAAMLHIMVLLVAQVEQHKAQVIKE